MPHQFKKHYSLEEARALLPEIRQWLSDLARLRQELAGVDEALQPRLAEGRDLGGRMVNRWIETLVAIKQLAQEFRCREIQIKDLDRGLIDFPAIIHDREVFLCWEQDEDDIEFWHELDTGYAGREKL
jgi:hypothetical protein